MASDQAGLKRAVADAAAALIESGMRVGLGTGSTADLFVEALARRISAGEIENLRFTATSKRTEELAARLGLECADLGSLGELSMTVDGADEIDPELRLIKGLGGALLREKIVAQASSRMVVIADESKLVHALGRGVLPVEVVRFAIDRMQLVLAKMELDSVLRRSSNSEPFLTDEHHYILDVDVPAGQVAEIATELKTIAGVVETGYFGDEATEALIGSATGVRHISRP